MTTPWNFQLGSLNLTAGGPVGAAKPTEETLFRIALLGDFSGRGGPPRSLADARPVRIDRDNFDDVMARFDPQVRLPLTGPGAAPVTVRFGELDDFHPDRLFGRLGAFEALRDLRRRLGNSSTFAKAAAEVRGWAGSAASAENPQPAPPPADSGSLLEQILGGPITPEPAPVPGGAADWNAFLRQAVAPYLVPGTDPDQKELVARVDEATSGQMRAILHHPDFQALEAAWRAVALLIRRLDTDEGLHLYLLDVRREDLAADLDAADDLRSTNTCKLFVERAAGTAGGQPWALLIGNYTFGPTTEDALLLARIGLVAAAAGAPFLAGADTRLFGCPSVAVTPDPDDWTAVFDPAASEVWQALRGTAQASSLGLAAPRFLLRLPYGRGAGVTEEFKFEELPPGARHQDYLWGNPAFACALLLGQGFNRFGWDLRPDEVLEIGSLPAHIYREDGESQLKPCAEAALSDRAAGRILGAGVMPLLSVQGTDRVRLGRFQSLAATPTALAGRWA
ncbi:MAG: type VI secretion system contractile sheath large subunit [Gemmataceae bacterium]|nr:type VI secretion system contractile sheath large subunit [Gemmataceae bacterium]